LVERVLITEAVHASLEPLGTRLEVDFRDGLWSESAALQAAVAECAGLVVRNQTRVDRSLLGAAPRLRVVGRLGAGLDNLDLDALHERGITVVHGGGLNARAVAEYVLGAVLDLARGLAAADRGVRVGGWTRRTGFELRGKTMAVLGLGKTGVETARVARGLGMRVVGHDPYTQRRVPGVEQLTLEEIFARAAVLSVHVPLTPQTRGMVGREELAALPAGAIVVNAARGGVVDEDALFAALQSGQLGGAALDVRTREPAEAGDRFSALDNVLLTPHLAGLTQESQSAIATHVLTGVRRALSGLAPRPPAIVA
jgi:phosphoglycerate dehydrogenase-like enzyme